MTGLQNAVLNRSRSNDHLCTNNIDMMIYKALKSSDFSVYCNHIVGHEPITWRKHYASAFCFERYI